MHERRRQYVKSIDGQLPTTEQLVQLRRLIMDGFVWIRLASDLNVAKAIANAFHNLPVSIDSPGFLWSFQLMYFENLAWQHPDVGAMFLATFDEITGFSHYGRK